MKKFLLAFLLSISAVAQQGIFPGTGGGGTSSGVAILPGTPNVVYTFVAGSDQTCTASTGKLTDISGSGNNATIGATAPTCNGTGYDFSNSTASVVSLPAALNSDKTYCIAAYLPTFGSTGTGLGATSFFDFLLGSSNISSTGVSWIISQGGTKVYNQYSYTNGSIRTNAADAEAGFHTLCWIQGLAGNSTTDRFFTDAVENVYFPTGVSGGGQTANNLVFGNNGLGYFDGILYYFAGWSGQLTPAQVKLASNAITTAVSSRGVQIRPPSELSSTLTLNAVGDSITAGFGATTTWEASLSGVNANYVPLNNGYYGISSHAILGESRWRDSLLCVGGFYPGMVINFSGTNDITSGSSAATVFGYLQSYAQILGRAGCQVGIGTMISRTGQDSGKDALNPLIRAGAANGNYFVVDFASLPLMGADGASANTTYFNVDAVHPNNAGQAQLAIAASNAINAYGIGSASSANPTVYSSNAVTMVNVDRFATIIPTAAATATLPDCLGVTGVIYQIFNASAGANTITFSGKASEAITGSATLAQNLAAKFQATLISQAAAGCGWQRIQ